MTPLLHPELVNDPFGDPALFVDFLREKRAMLIDMGDLSNLRTRKILRLSHAFVSHTHMDHFCGFDRILRVSLGRPKRLHIFGPGGFIDKVEHKLSAYTWNLYESTSPDFCVVASELAENGQLSTVQFCFRRGFRRDRKTSRLIKDGIIVDENLYRVRAVHLDHRIPCLAFAIEEKQHLNVWRNRVFELGLGIGPWLNELKQAIRRGEPDDLEIAARWREGNSWREERRFLGDLRKLVKIVPGQRIAYVTDAGFTPENIKKIIGLAQGADLLFIESPFLRKNADIAAQKMHLTAHQAGMIARDAGVRRFELFHFSPRYEGQAGKLREEAFAAAGSDKDGNLLRERPDPAARSDEKHRRA